MKYATLLLLLTACSYINSPAPVNVYKGMTDGAPEGTPAFREGWKAGCESGIAAIGSLHYKATHSFTYDETRLDDDEYHNAWRMGFRHCRWYTGEWQR
ncbi:MAG: hypothetical protein K0R98_408 [Rickettsiaceae bacterium]|nr:hypothetical protein [Rickettsiaceae bacterium]